MKVYIYNYPEITVLRGTKTKYIDDIEPLETGVAIIKDGITLGLNSSISHTTKEIKGDEE